MTTLGTFQKTVEKSNQWIEDVMEELSVEDPHVAYQALRSVLQALRDHLTLEETAHFGAQLPMLIRGLYYEGWRPAGHLQKERHEGAFLLRIAEHLARNPYLADLEVLEDVAVAVFRVISRHVTAGEIEDIKGDLPAELRQLWH